MTTSRLPDISDTDPFVAQAIREIFSSYGVTVSVVDKKKSLNKFGRNELTTNSAPGSTVMTLPPGIDNETYPATNAIDTISSSSASDTEPLTIEGHTISGSDFTFLVQSKTLTGQTKAVLDTPLCRISRIYNTGSSDLVGTVYGYQDGAITAGVPDTDADVHIMIRAGKNNTEKCATTLSSQDFWIVSAWGGSVLEKTSTYAEIELQVREFGSVFRTVDNIGVAAGNTVEETFNPYLIFPANSDVRVIAIGSAANLDVTGVIHGYLAKIV